MENVVRSKSSARTIASLLGLGFTGALVFTTTVALRHMLETPQRLESPLPGESLYYKWKHGFIFYKVLGAPEAPPLLLLHTPEIAASAYEMRKIIEPLAQSYRVFAPDLIGFGLSDRPNIDYSADTYVSLCRDFLTDVVKQPATMMASRISCNYAITTAASAPDLCERLVLISPSAVEGGNRGNLHLPALHTEFRFMNAWTELLQSAPLQWVLYPMLSTRFGLRYLLKKQHTLLTDADLDYYYATTHQFGAQGASMALLAGKLTQDVSKQLETLPQPMLVIWGDRGPRNAGNNGSQQNVSWTKVHTRLLLLPDAGFLVHEENPETVIATILEWNEESKAATAPKVNTSPEAYCMKCKTKRRMLNPTEVTMKNGRRALRGTCEICGASINRIGRSE